jgi:hypothetical protein
MQETGKRRCNEKKPQSCEGKRPLSGLQEPQQWKALVLTRAAAAVYTLRIIPSIYTYIPVQNRVSPSACASSKFQQLVMDKRL